MFFAGAVQLVFTVLLWLLELLARQMGTSFLSAQFPHVYLHALLMYFGVFPYFMFGFLLTVFPRWLQTPPARQPAYVVAWVTMGAGWLIIYGAAILDGAWITAGLLLCILGWGVVWWELLRVFNSRSTTASHYEIIVLVAVSVGTLMLIGVTVGHAGHHSGLVVLALDGALWLFLLPIAFTVSYRMIPFFSGLVMKDYQVYQPRWLLAAGLLAMLGHMTFTVFDSSATWVFDLALAVTAARLSWSWGLTRSFPVRLLAMLHIAFVWLAAAGLLFALQGLMVRASGEEYVLGRAPLHAVGIGFLASLVVAFASRVSLGHSGRGLVANRLTWLCFLGFQVVAVLRIAADLPRPGMDWSSPLHIAAALIWVAAAAIWSAYYLPVYLRPRIDGRPG